MLVDDHSVVRMGLASVLSLEKDLQVVAEADDGESAVTLFRELHPDVTLMDVRMPGIGGVAAVRRIHAEFPDARIVMLTTYDTEEDLFNALDAGATGYLLKSVQREELVAAIHRAHAGERCIPQSLARRLQECSDHRELSPREKEVLDLMRRGLHNRDIGVALGITEHTAKAHVKAILSKLEAADRTEAVATGYERGLLRP